MLIRRLRYWMESARRSEALREEMELHLAEKAAELQADGMTAERARAEARRRFGNVGLKHEESREIWMTRFLSELGQDVRYGCRTMTANKAFSALAVLSLALGIGANTAIYSFMESILLRSLPVADPESLVVLNKKKEPVADPESLVVLNWHSRPPQNANKEWVHVMHGVQGMAWPGDKGAMVSGMFPYGAFETLREENPVFSTLFGYFNGLTITWPSRAGHEGERKRREKKEERGTGHERQHGVRHRRVFSRPGSVAGRGTSDRLRRRPSRRSAGRRNQFCDKPKSLWGTAECDWTVDSRR